ALAGDGTVGADPGFVLRMLARLPLPARITELLVAYWVDTGARAGFYMLLNTAVTGGLGIIYWVVAARLYPQVAVGRGAALQSAVVTLAGFGEMHLSGMLMRFLPIAEAHSRRLVLLAYGAAAAATLVLTGIAIGGVNVLTDPSSPLRIPTLGALLFLASTVGTVLFTLEDAVLMALRKTVWVPLENGGFGIAKIILLVVFSGFGTWGAVFASGTLPLALALPLITWLLFGWLLPKGGKHGWVVTEARKKEIRRFATGDAVGGISGAAVTPLLPVVVTAVLGPRQNAIFYQAIMYSMTIDMISVNYSMPLIVEAAHDPGALSRLLISTIRRTYMVLGPVVLVFVLGSSLLMHMYGPAYVKGATLLSLLALACLPRALTVVLWSLCRVEQRTRFSGLIQLTTAVVTIGGTAVAAQYGLNAVGFLIVGIQLVVATFAAFYIRHAIVRARSAKAA
ncbi:MAG: hypothetical protein J2O48_08725, partial [Solirubrobacterales bacterium]|nr:hypothetical protein [Solirubrobacterales bacterium]